MNKVYLDFIIEDEGHQLAIDDSISFTHNVIGESMRMLLMQQNRPTTYNEVRKVLNSHDFLQTLRNSDLSALPPVYRNVMNVILTYDNDYLLLLCSGPYLYEHIEVNNTDHCAISLKGLGVESFEPGNDKIYMTLSSYDSAKKYQH